MSKKRGHRHALGKKVHLDALRNDINVTPLVDVCLVLLIIFMIITPLMARGQEVPLPATRNHSQKKDEHQPVVALDRDGNLYYEKEKLGPITPETLEKMKTNIERAWETRPETMGHVYVKSDESLDYATVYKLIIEVNEGLGVTQIDLATKEFKEK